MESRFPSAPNVRLVYETRTNLGHAVQLQYASQIPCEVPSFPLKLALKAQAAMDLKFIGACDQNRWCCSKIQPVKVRAVPRPLRNVPGVIVGPL